MYPAQNVEIGYNGEEFKLVETKIKRGIFKELALDPESSQSVAIYVCTFQRNEPLRSLLASVRAATKRVQPEVQVAVVVVDDNPDGRAQAVVESEDFGFDLGLHYRHSGAQNISVARNMGIEACLELADWVAMVDDDQVVEEGWLEALFETQKQYQADAVTGPVFLRYGEEYPSWLHEEPFGDILEATPEPDGSVVGVCSTGNSMISSDFLKNNPEIRFRQDLGTLGGEDMVFYREAVDKGLKAHYSRSAVSWGEQPPERSNLNYQLRASMWMGNTEYITNIESGSSSKGRMVLRAGKRALGYLARPVQRVVAGKNPQVRFMLAGLAQVTGMLAGVFGVRLEHI